MNRKTYPLTQSQLGMYLDWNADRASCQYVICLEYAFPSGSVEVDRIAAAVKSVFAHYPVLRMHLVEEDGEVAQFADDDYVLDVAVREIAETDAAHERAAFVRPYLSTREPFMRAQVLVSPERIRLLVSFLHFVMDGTSERFFARALEAAYAGLPLPAESFSIADYALQESALFDLPEYAAARDEHRVRFVGKSMTVPEDPEALHASAPRGRLIRHVATLSRDPVEAFCRAREVHPNLFFMGVFARALALYANRNDVVFYTVNHGRRDPRLAEAMGLFVKTVPCLAELKGDVTLTEFLRSLKLHRAGVYPFTHFCRDLGMTQGLGYVFQDGTVEPSVTFRGVRSEAFNFGPVGVGCKPALEVYGDAERFELHVSCLSGEYSQAWVEAFAERCAEIARQFLAHPDVRLGDIPVVSDAEAAELQTLSSGERLAYDADRTFIDLFDAHAAATPDRVALVDSAGTVTYGGVRERSCGLAGKLVANGVKAGGFVGVLLPRRNVFPVAVLAVQRCGCGYVPLDPEYPAERLDYMLADSEASVLITTHELFDRKGLKFGGKIVFLDGEDEGEGERRILPLTPASPAYMIYTSGSTGRPKGVVVSHRALVAMCAWMRREMRLDGTSRVAVTASFSFDASVIDLFPVLSAGGELHVFSEALRKDIGQMCAYAREHALTGWTMSTQLGLATLNACPEVPLRYMMLGGEKMVPFAKTSVRVYNGYGPTEFTVCSSFHLVDPSQAGEIPIGRPVPNSRSFVCDALGQLAPRGLVGELCLAGAQIADGYWRLPEKTASAFANGRYRTGDFVRWNAAGVLEYRGRIDEQVKIRGFRIEIGEIEHAAVSCEGVTACVVDVREVGGTKHLVLYYCGTAETESVRAKLSATLTDYMVPDYFMRVSEMPVKPGGKIDRKALPMPRLTEEPVEPPANELEAKILALVRSVLKSDAFGVTQDFNRLGLTSLGAMALVARLKRECGVSVSLSALAKMPTVRLLAAGAKSMASTATSAVRRPPRTTYPMTENQRGIYVDWLRNPGATQYNIPVVFRFPETDPQTLAEAVRKMLDVHPVFKTRFVEHAGEVVQSRRDGTFVTIPVETLAEPPDAAFFATRVRPFAPAGADLVRATVFAAPDAAYLFFDAHHTVCDGTSLGVFLDGLKRVLGGQDPKTERATAFDAALDERDYLESDLVAEDDAWFGCYLAGCESTRLDLPPPRTPAAPGTAARVSVRLPAAPVSGRASELGVSASDWFLASFMELLRRIGRTDDVQIVFVSSGRSNADFADSVGMFVKTLPVRNVRDRETFSETVRALHGCVLEILDRERVSYARLAERNGLRPEIVFAFEGGLFDLPDGVELLPLQTERVKFPLSVTVTPGRDDFELAFEYDASRYGADDMRALLAMFATLAQGAVGEDSLRAIPLVPPQEAEELVARSSGASLAYDAAQTFVDLFREQANARPEATAVVDCERALAYAALEAESDALAHGLAEAGAEAGRFVGVMLPRRAEFVIAVLAVQKCGCGYVPLDAEYPTDRLAYMLENSEAPVLVTTHALYDKKGLKFDGKVVFLEGEGAGEGEQRALPLTPSSPAYMIYTSGSTGRPKGVVISHRALRHMLAWAIPMRRLAPGVRLLEHASFSFDASVIDIFPTLAAGGELHILDERLRRDLPGIRDYITAHSITAAGMPTQIGMALLDAYPDLPLEHLMLGGEKLMPTSPTKIRIVNGYGPTEFCVCSSFQEVDLSETGDIPIGRPVPGTSSLIVDRYGHLLPQGFPGEIALAGPQLADGYWHLPEKTAAVFTNGRYRTGDLARYDARGRLQYLGRIDFQVKLRGFRIEIGEIEHAASRFQDVQSVAAEVRDVGGAQHLVLYYAAAAAVAEPAFRAFLADSLPAYMIPDYFVQLDEMPFTPGGKIDRRQLPIPKDADGSVAYVEPSGDAERTIAETYGAVLRREPYGATDDFFACGGTSIIAIKAVVALQKRGLDVQYGDLFRYKTPRDLAAFLTGSASPSSLAFGAYDYAAIDALLSKARTDLFTDFRCHALGNVLLTGATGYLGMHVLRRLLETTDATVFALVRSRSGRAPERRLGAEWVYYFGERLPQRFAGRIVLVDGDVTDEALIAKLAGRRVDTVINCAALVKHYVADDAMDRINIGGVENLVSLCAKTGARLVHTSTYSVGGTVRRDSSVALDERHLYIGQETDNDYVRTKFLAERLVLEATAAGRVRGKVMRLGNLMGRESDGEFQLNVGANAFVNSLKSYKAIGAYPLEELWRPLEMSPIDRVAEAVVLLATTPDDMVVFHPYNCYALDMGAVVAAMNRRGFNVDCVSRTAFAAYVDALRNDPGRAQELQGVLHYAGHILADRKITPVVNGYTTTALYRLGFRWLPADDLYLKNFLDMLDGLAVFG